MLKLHFFFPLRDIAVCSNRMLKQENNSQRKKQRHWTKSVQRKDCFNLLFQVAKIDITVTICLGNNFLICSCNANELESQK